jgi:hypothetical protein
MPNTYTVLEAKTEERPVHFEFKKCDFVTHAVLMANLNYDPFPNNGLEDVVRREIVCTELVLTAKIKSKDASSICPGTAIEYEGHKFVIKNASDPIPGDMPGESTVIVVEGSCFLTPCEPMKVLAQLRETYARSSRS